MGDQRTQRKIALEGARFTPAEALAAGLLDHVVPGNTEDMLAKASEVAGTVGGLAKGGVWGVIKVGETDYHLVPGLIPCHRGTCTMMCWLNVMRTCQMPRNALRKRVSDKEAWYLIPCMGRCKDVYMCIVTWARLPRPSRKL